MSEWQKLLTSLSPEARERIAKATVTGIEARRQAAKVKRPTTKLGT